ncbi:MAG: DegT/DnrJ/EryC1/StrS family aminotransferase [Actinobacteria bacterium]|nr:DegT/DnrJ/EryC1/StrS family aminotransferase [Actinomycetota bacterium]
MEQGVRQNQISIPVYKPSLDGKEREYVLECIDSSWISSRGKFIGLFEHEFARYVGAHYAAGVPNGTIALHLCMLALGVGPGDEVIIPTLTYISSANCVTYTGATPVFADSRESDWQIDPNDIARRITANTKAIMAVHLYGGACDMDALTTIASENSLFLVEDCAEGIGTLYKGKHVGGFGDIAAFSFFGNKTITTGEGGMVVTNDETLYERVTRFRGQGLAKYREYWHDIVGYNYRMTNICAAIGLAQLERVETFLERKRKIAERYRERLEGLPLTLQSEPDGVRHSYWMVSILLDDHTDRDPLRDHLAKKGVETRPFFNPIHTMPMYASRFQRFPVAESLSRRGINLPSWPDLELELVDFICNSIIEYFQNKPHDRR